MHLLPQITAPHRHLRLWSPALHFSNNRFCRQPIHLIIFGNQYMQAGQIEGQRLNGRRGLGEPRLRNSELRFEVETTSFDSSLVNPMLSPINSTSVLQIASPSPAPPYCRVIDPSACSNGREIRSCLLSPEFAQSPARLRARKPRERAVRGRAPPVRRVGRPHAPTRGPLPPGAPRPWPPPGC